MYSCRPETFNLHVPCTPTIFLFEADGSLSLYKGLSPEKKEELVWSSKRYKSFPNFLNSIFKKVSKGDYYKTHVSCSQISGRR